MDKIKCDIAIKDLMSSVHSLSGANMDMLDRLERANHDLMTLLNAMREMNSAGHLQDYLTIDEYSDVQTIAQLNGVDL